MQSKLPVRIKRRHLSSDRKKCCCAKLWKIVLDQPADTDENTYCISNIIPNSDIQKLNSRSTQTDFSDSGDNKAYTEIKSLLISIHETLESILETLQGKKDYLYNKLQEDSAVPLKKIKVHHKTKNDKVKKKTYQLNKKSAYYAWPEISRVYYGQTPWIKHYMQKFSCNVSPASSNLIICPSQPRWMDRHFSCSDINYFQPMLKMLERPRPYGISVFPHSIYTLVGEGDLNIKKAQEKVDTGEKTYERNSSPSPDSEMEI